MSFQIAKSGAVIQQLEMFSEQNYIPPKTPPPPKPPPRPTVSYAQAYTAFLDQLQNEADPWEAQITVGDESHFVQFCKKDGDWSFFSAIRAAEIELNYERIEQEQDDAQFEAWLEQQPREDIF